MVGSPCPHGHIAFITGFALISWGEESQGFALGPNTRHMFLLQRHRLLPLKGLVPVAHLSREALCCVQSSSRHQQSVAQEQSRMSVFTEKNLLFRFGFGNQFGLFVSVILKYFRDHNHHKI